MFDFQKAAINFLDGSDDKTALRWGRRMGKQLFADAVLHGRSYTEVKPDGTVIHHPVEDAGDQQ